MRKKVSETAVTGKKMCKLKLSGMPANWWKRENQQTMSSAYYSGGEQWKRQTRRQKAMVSQLA